VKSPVAIVATAAIGVLLSVSALVVIAVPNPLGAGVVAAAFAAFLPPSTTYMQHSMVSNLGVSCMYSVQVCLCTQS
jgi:hypothetical protein